MRILLAPFALAFLAACGPGGDGGTPDAPGGGDAAMPPGGDATVPGDAAGPPDDLVGPSGDAAVEPGPSGCQPIVHQSGVTVAGQASDRYTWSDTDCRARSAALAHAGYLRQATYTVGGQTRTITGTGANGWNGWGYVVLHYASSAATSRNTTPTRTTVLDGRHHAIHEYRLRLSPGGPVDATIHWLIATGRSHPLYSITLDSSPAGADAVDADSRAPYGDLDWDGTGNDEVEGLGWGDKYRFRTTGPGPVTQQTPWRYDQANRMPHVVEWSAGADAEMGAVATLPWDLRAAGGDYGGGLIDACWTRTSANPGQGCRPAGQVMPQDWLWPYQLNQYELPFLTTSRRLAWGLTFGAVGQRAYTAFGQTLSGYPYQSYAVHMVLGRHAPSAVEAQIADLEAAADTRITATRGTVPTTAPGGVGRMDAVPLEIPGYDPVYGVWVVRAAGGGATVRLDAGGRLANPVLRVEDYGAAAAGAVRLDGRVLVADADYFATVDAPRRTLWLTLNATLTGSVVVSID